MLRRRRVPLSSGPYGFGQCLVDAVFDEDELDEDDVDDFDVGELEAAWAMAAPPPTSAPDNASAVRALVNRCRMGLSPPSGSRGSLPDRVNRRSMRNALEEPKSRLRNDEGST
jgi:hypothetical protein